jgi:hypothetical protein
VSFEQGPIRPPSEASSLLVRVGRNCPWNRCTFCPVYKGRKFSRRSLEEVVSDIDEVADALEAIREEARGLDLDAPTPRLLSSFLRSSHPGSAMQAAAWWLLRGEGTVFLQDADPIAMRTESLEKVLRHLHRRLPGITRVTAYARTATLASRGKEKLGLLRDAGLDRVHVGFESGSDAVLEMVKKGSTQARHVKGGRAAVEAGLELSAYLMPGLGGRGLWREHAVESARVVADVEPHFTRLRTLAVVGRAPLHEMVGRGFDPLDDDEVMREIRLFLENLEGVTTRLRSDHVLNLLGDLEGDLPGDHQKLLDLVDTYLGLPEQDRLAYRIGRRAGLFHGLYELDDPNRRAKADALVESVGGDPDSVDAACRELMRQWV